MAKDGQFLLPVAEDEAFWVGLTAMCAEPRMWVGLSAEVADGRILDALSGEECEPLEPAARIVVPPAAVVPGIRQADGRWSWVFTRIVPRSSPVPVCHTVCLLVESAEGPWAVTDLRLSSYEEFAARTGSEQPEPLNLGNGYKGWRLP
jgi:hypothetical protein